MKTVIGCGLVALAAMLATAAPVMAQGHPCDAPLVQGVTTKTNFTGQFCTDSRDADGTPVTITTVQVLLDGAVKVMLGALPAAVGAPNALGESLYQVPNVSAGKGTHRVAYRLGSAEGLADPSGDQTITVINGPPKPATNAGIVSR